jgi:transcriptional regulator with XRE-family HTH domain
MLVKRGPQTRVNLAVEMVKRGWSPRYVAAAIGVHPNSVRSWVRGDKFPNAENLIALAGVFGLDAAYLMSRAGDSREC